MKFKVVTNKRIRWSWFLSSTGVIVFVSIASQNPIPLIAILPVAGFMWKLIDWGYDNE